MILAYRLTSDQCGFKSRKKNVTGLDKRFFKIKNELISSIREFFGKKFEEWKKLKLG